MSSFNQVMILIAPTLGAGLFSMSLRSWFNIRQKSFRGRAVGTFFGLIAAMSLLVALGMLAVFSYGAAVTGSWLALIGIPIGLYVGYVSEPAISKSLKFGHTE